MRITQETKLESDVIEQYWKIYDATFAPIAHLSPCRQSLTYDEFVEEMGLDSVIKFVLWDDEDVVAAMCFIATDLNAVAWISPAYFEANYPEQYARGAIYYYQTLLVSPEFQGGEWVTELLKELVLFTANNRAIAAFDCSHFRANEGFPRLIGMIAEKYAVVDAKDLKQPQHYYAYITYGVKDNT